MDKSRNLGRNADATTRKFHENVDRNIVTAVISGSEIELGENEGGQSNTVQQSECDEGGLTQIVSEFNCHI